MKTSPLQPALALAALVLSLASCVQPPWSDDSRVFSSSPYSTQDYPEQRSRYSGYLGSSYSYYDRGYGSPYYHGGYYDRDHDHSHDSSHAGNSGTKSNSHSTSSSDTHKSSSQSRGNSSENKNDTHPTRGNANESRGSSRSSSSSDDKRQSRGRS